MSVQQKEVLIIGGGNAGLSAAAQIKNRDSKLQVTVIDPAEYHYYQPAWTLVGAGTYDAEKTKRRQADVIPNGVEWIQEAAETFEPEKNLVHTKNGKSYTYKYLIVCPGIQLNWGDIKGLKENLGKNGVCSNYKYDMAQYTWECLKSFKGGNALFTQPATPIKCGGAPQKIMYLAEDYLQNNKLRSSSEVAFFTPGGVIFGVEVFANVLKKVIKRKDIKVKFKHELVEIDGEEKIAYFKVDQDTPSITTIDDAENKLKAQRTEDGLLAVPFDMIHVTPPQSAPDFIKNSPLADPESPFGWVEVDPKTLQHKRFENIFSLGDAGSMPNAKTGAAIRKQAPVLVENLFKVMQKDEMKNPAAYDGYGSCPLVTGYGKMVLAEFNYDNEPTPSLPIDTAKERWSMWILKKYVLPWLYWNKILKGKA